MGFLTLAQIEHEQREMICTDNYLECGGCRTQLGGEVGKQLKETDPLYQLLQYQFRQFQHRINTRYTQVAMGR